MPGKRLTITDTVRRLLEESGLSQYEICQKSGVDKGAMSRFMAGQGGLSLVTLDKLAEAMGWRLVATPQMTSTKDTKRAEAKRRK